MELWDDTINFCIIQTAILNDFKTPYLLFYEQIMYV